MPAYLHRTTLQYRASVSEQSISDPQNWIREPDLSAVAGFPSIYWIVTGDSVSLMSPAQRAARDAELLSAARDAAASQFQQQEDVLRAFMLLVMDEFNAHGAKVNAILTAIDNASTLANLKTAVAAITDLPTRTEQQLRTAIRSKLGT